MVQFLFCKRITFICLPKQQAENLDEFVTNRWVFTIYTTTTKSEAKLLSSAKYEMVRSNIRILHTIEYYRLLMSFISFEFGSNRKKAMCFVVVGSSSNEINTTNKKKNQFSCDIHMRLVVFLFPFRHFPH